MPEFLICHRYEQNAGQENDACCCNWPALPPRVCRSMPLCCAGRERLFGAAAANVELCVTENNSVHNNPHGLLF